MTITCYADIAHKFAGVTFYETFLDVLFEGMRLTGKNKVVPFIDSVCGDVWRQCKRNNDMRTWNLFKLYSNRIAHENGELADDRVLTFTWAGKAY